MRWLAGLSGAAACAASLLVAAGAGADEAIARRIAALDSLVRPEAARRARAEAKRSGGACGAAWWRMRDYALESRIDTAVRHASIRYAVDSELIRAVIQAESNYRVEAVSSAGAMGLMQLMPATARDLGVVCPFDPRENVMAGTRYLRRLRGRLGSWPKALAGYHAGPRRVEQRRIPAETRRYVRLVVAGWRPQLLAWIDLD